MKIIHHLRFQCISLLCLVLFCGLGVSFADSPKTQGKIGKELHSPNWKDRKEAVSALEKIYPATPQVVDVLKQALQDSSKQVRSQTRETIRIINILGSDLKPLIPDLLARLKNPQETTSLKDSLPLLLFQVSAGSSEVVKELLTLAKDHKEELLIRWRSLRVLGEVKSGDESLRQGLRDLARHDPSSIIQSQAWLTLARLWPHDDEIVKALVKMGQGDYGLKQLLHAGVTSVSFHPLSEALNLLMSMGKWEQMIPLYLDAVDQTQDRIPLDLYRFTYHLQAHPSLAKPYVPRFLTIVARPSTHFDQMMTRSYFSVILLKVAPHSPEFRNILENLEKDPDPELRKRAKAILQCIDPHAPASVKENIPCSSIPELPSVNAEADQKMEIRILKRERGLE